MLAVGYNTVQCNPIKLSNFMKQHLNVSVAFSRDYCNTNMKTKDEIGLCLANQS